MFLHKAMATRISISAKMVDTWRWQWGTWLKHHVYTIVWANQSMLNFLFSTLVSKLICILTKLVPLSRVKIMNCHQYLVERNGIGINLQRFWLPSYSFVHILPILKFFFYILHSFILKFILPVSVGRQVGSLVILAWNYSKKQFS